MNRGPARLVRKLSELGQVPGQVVTVYIDLEPGVATSPGGRATLIDTVLHDARQKASALPKHEAKSVEADLERIRERLESDPPEGARAVAIFASAPSEVFEIVQLAAPVSTAAYVEPGAVVEPLLEALPSGEWCVLLVNRRLARILRGDRERLREQRAFEDNVPSKTEQGGWSQARYQRHADGAAEQHAKRACDELFTEYQRAPFDALVVGALDETWPWVDDHLHSYLRSRLAGRIDVEVERSDEAKVLEAVRPIVDDWERDREKLVLEHLNLGLGRGRGAAAGLPAVLDAVHARRVETLILGRRFAKAGVACPSCGWLGLSGGRCPYDKTPTQPRPDVVEDAIDEAAEQSAVIVVLRHNDYDHPDGPIAAVLRF